MAIYRTVTNNMAQVFHECDECFMCFRNVLCMMATSVKGTKVLRKRHEFAPQKIYLKNISRALPHTPLGALTLASFVCWAANAAQIKSLQ